MTMLREVTADVMRIAMRVLEFIGATSVAKAVTGLSIPLALLIGLVLLIAIRWTARWTRD